MEVVVASLVIPCKLNQFGVFAFSWVQRELGASVGGRMAAGSVLGGNRERVEVWPQGLWIQLSVVVPLGVDVYLVLLRPVW